MDIEIKERTKVKALIYGKEILLSKPTVGQIEKMQMEMKSAAEKGLTEVTVMKNFAATIGLPTEVCEQLEVDQFLELVEKLTATKKK